MLIKSFYQVGRVFFSNQSALQVLVSLQNEVRDQDGGTKPRLLIITADITDLSKIQYAFSIIDYVDEDKYKYLLGLTSGTTANYSFSSSTGWEKDKKKASRFDKIIAIRKKIIGKIPVLQKLGPPGEWIGKLLESINEKKTDIEADLNVFLKNQGYTKFQMPLVFQIKDKAGSKFLGEIPEMQHLYELLFLEDTTITATNAKCAICNADEGLRQGFSIGTFSLDHSAFKYHFFEERNKLPYQYIMCNDCYLLVMLGYTIVEKKLKFYAYSVKDGRKKTPIFHYLIPVADDLATLNQNIKMIEKAKHLIDQRRRNNITDTIRNLNEKLRDIDAKAISKARDEIGKAKAIKKDGNKEKNEIETQIAQKREALEKPSSNFSLIDLITNLYQNNKFLAVHDVYFKITNSKLNPKSKSIVSEIFLSSEQIQTIGNNFKTAADHFGYSSINLNSLQKVLDDWKFIHYYASLLRLEKVSKTQFYKDCGPHLKHLFLESIVNQNRTGFSQAGYRQPLRIFEVYNYMMTKAGLWKV